MHRWAVRLLHPRCCGELGGCVRRGMGNGRVSVSFRTFQWQQRTERDNVNNDDMRQDKTYRKRAARFLQLPVVSLPRRTVRVSHEPTGAETRAHPACGERVMTPAGCWPPKCGPMSKNYRSEKEEPLFFSSSERVCDRSGRAPSRCPAPVGAKPLSRDERFLPRGHVRDDHVEVRFKRGGGRKEGQGG